MSTVPTIVVRRAEPADHPALQRIYWRASLSNAGDRPALLAHPEFLRLDEGLIGRGRTRVATLADGTIVGFASTSFSAEGLLELDDLFTDPRWRRRGAAMRLVRQIVAEAAAERVKRLGVIANGHALEFYRAAGFKDDGPVRTMLGMGTRMHLDIAEGPANPAVTT